MTHRDLADLIANIQTRNPGTTVALLPTAEGWRADMTVVHVNPANPSLMTERSHVDLRLTMSRDEAHQALWYAMLGRNDERINAW